MTDLILLKINGQKTQESVNPLPRRYYKAECQMSHPRAVACCLLFKYSPKGVVDERIRGIPAKQYGYYHRRLCRNLEELCRGAAEGVPCCDSLRMVVSRTCLLFVYGCHWKKSFQSRNLTHLGRNFQWRAGPQDHWCWVLGSIAKYDQWASELPSSGTAETTLPTAASHPPFWVS